MTSGRRRRPLSAALRATRDVIVDLSELRFADSSLMIDLAVLAQRLRAQGRTLSLRHPQPHDQRLIEIVGLRPAAGRAARRGQPAGAASANRRSPPAQPPLSRRGSLRVVRLLLVLLFIVVPIAELAIIIQVGELLGVLVDDRAADRRLDARLAAHALAGPGRVAALHDALQAGRPPAREVVDGVLIIFGGALLLTPGFITDIVGLLFLLPPTRALIRRLLLRRAMRADRGVDGRGRAPRAAARAGRAPRGGRRGRHRRRAWTAGAWAGDGRPGGRGGARRRHGQRDVRVRRRARRSSTGWPGSGSRASRRAAGSALAVLFAGREPGGGAGPRRRSPSSEGAAGRRSSWPGCGRRSSSRSRAGARASRRRAATASSSSSRPSASPPGPATATRSRGSAAWPGYEQLCRVRGTVRAGGRERRVDCLGQRGHAWGDAGLGAHRARPHGRGVAGAGAGVALAAVRPAGARHHADEAVWGALSEPEGGSPSRTRACRPPTTATAASAAPGSSCGRRGDGDDGWARRGAGEVLCGSTLDLGALRLDCAFFRWQMEGRAGVGRYDVLRRAA